MDFTLIFWKKLEWLDSSIRSISCFDILVEFIPDPNSNLLSSNNNHGFSDGWTGINWEYRDQTRYRHLRNLPIGKSITRYGIARVNVVNVIWNLWIHTAWFLRINNCINNWINKWTIKIKYNEIIIGKIIIRSWLH